MKLIHLLALGAITVALLGTSCTKSAKPVVPPSSLSSDPVAGTDVAVVDSEKIVYTPFGPRKAADVVILHPGAHLRHEGDQLLEVDKSGAVLRNLGVQKPLSYVEELTKKLAQGKSQVTRKTVGDYPNPVFGTGWITDAVAYVPNPITYFSTNWTVPATPGTNGGLIYIFNGLENEAGSVILQPVLQYGAGPDGGGNYWSVNNWYVTCSTCAVLGGSSPTPVSVGTKLTGVMQQVGASGSNYSYSSSFTQYPGVNLTVENIGALTLPFETVEAYAVTSRSDYPIVNDIPMTGINLQAGGTNPSLSWEAEDRVTQIGQHTVVVSNANPGGEVDLYVYTPITGGGDYDVVNNGDTQSGTITGIPGEYVYVEVRANGHPGFRYNLAAVFNGGTFANTNGNLLQATNGVAVDFLQLPASGTVTWSAYYTETNTTGSGGVTIENASQFN